MYGCLTVMVSALWVGAIGIETESNVVYTVSQVTAVEVPTAFICRLGDYAWPTPVQFKVQLRVIEMAADPNTARTARRFLYERLTNARQVKLTAIQDHGYFRLTADVMVDGQDVATEMIQYGLMRSSVMTAENPENTLIPSRKQALSDVSTYSETRPHPRPVPVPLRPLPLEKLLAQEADLSGISSETTLQEALFFIAEATRPKLPILILWNDLQQNSMVGRDTPVGLDGFGKMTVGKALELILKSVSPSPVSLIAIDEGGILTIATQHGIAREPRLGVYPVTDIVAAPSEERLQQTGYGGSMSG